MKISIIIILLISGCINAQKTVVEYVTNGFGQDHIEKQILLFDEKESYNISFSKNLDQSIENLFSNFKFTGNTTFRNSINPNDVYIISSMINTKGNKLLFLDSKPQIIWTIKPDVKTILGYPCQKAVGDFRGRTWEVWFTKDIQSNLGPWKLDGLPGLILEAKDTNGIISIEVNQIINHSKYEVPTQITDFINQNYPNKSRLYKDYVVELDHYLMTIRDEAIANLPKGSVLVDTPNDLRSLSWEYTYEWETPKTPK